MISHVYVFGQSDEKLLKYKDLYEKGLIDSIEYKALKSKELGIGSEGNTKIISDSSLSKLLSNAKAQRNSGVVLIGLGTLSFVGTAIYWTKAIPKYSLGSSNTYQEAQKVLDSYNRAVKQYKTNRVVFGGLSIIALSLGLAALDLSEKKFKLYDSKRLAFNFGLQDSGLGLCLNFK